MKKTLVVSLIVVMALAIFATAAFAQDSQPASTGYGMMGMGSGHGPRQGDGPLHDYFIAVIAAKLDLTPTEVESRLAEGESLYAIAIAEGQTAATIPTLLADARAAALDAAVQAGDITQAQADWMKTNQPGGQMCDGPQGLLHSYMVDAIASTLKLTTTEVEARLAAGERPYDIVVAAGTATDQVQTVLTNIHTAAIEAALKHGVITQAQADAMQNNPRGFDHMGGGMFGDGPHGHGPMGGGRGPQGGRNGQP